MGKLLPALAGAIAACVAGCGGGNSSSLATPTATTKTYLTAVGDGNGDAACVALEPGFRQTTLSKARAQGIKANSCPELFRQVSAQLDSATRDKFKRARITAVSTSGDTATVTVADASDHPRLVRTGSKWLITGGIGF